jgi:GNAT superfamily N-acetyltransferase
MEVIEDGRLADGRPVTLCWAGHYDVAAIAALYQELSEDSFRNRFQCTRPAVTVLARFASLGPGTRCIVAVSPDEPGRLVAEARYVTVDMETAEIALTVRDDYQGAGLGHLLLAVLTRAAAAEGRTRLRGDVLLGNTPMLRLMQRHGCAVTGCAADHSEASLEISAIGGMPGWPADGDRPRVLVEQHGWFDGPVVGALRAAGYDIRRCAGPRSRAGRGCTLVETGECRLAEEADQILYLLPAGDPDCAAVLAAHRRHWPQLLASS